MKYSFIALIFLLCLSFFGTSYAQNNPISQTTINIELIPETPKAGDIVYASLTSYATDINVAVITWKVNGRTLKSGVGEKNFTFTVGGIGTKTTLGLTVVTREGETIEQSLVIKPAEIDLIWQSKSLVPPFYKGKAMFSHQNEITFVAIPHMIGSNGREIGVKNLVYRWKKNGSVVEEASGFGKNTYTFISPLISRPLNIEVEAYSPNDEGLALGYAYIAPTDPLVMIYKKDPTYGISFQKALLNSVELDGSKEATLIGVPLFFGATTPSDRALSYKWSINSAPIGNDPESRTQTFRQKDGTSGSSRISLSIENAGKILQYGSSSFNLRFGGIDNE